MSRDWPRVPLADACILITDGTHHSPPNASSGDFKYVTAKNIRKWGLDLSDITYVDAKTHSEIYKRCPVEEGDVLYIKDGVTTGLAAINTLSEPFSMLSSVALLKPKRSVLSPRYLKHWLNSPETFARMTSQMTGSAIKRLVLKQIRSAAIPLPPLAEQERIADKLDRLLTAVDTCKARVDAIPAILKRFRQSVLAAAVSPRVTAEELGIDQVIKWTRTSIGEVATVVRGASPRPAGDPRYFGGDIPWITVGELTKDGCKYLDAVSSFVTEQGRERSRYIEPDTLLLTNSGATLGVPKITRVGGCINDGSVALLGIEEPLKSYVYYVLSAMTEKLRSINQGAAQPNLNTSIVKAIQFDLPDSLQAQSEIVSHIESLLRIADRLDEKLKSAHAYVEKLTQGLLSMAFRGELTAASSGTQEKRYVLNRSHRTEAKAASGFGAT